LLSECVEMSQPLHCIINPIQMSANCEVSAMASNASRMSATVALT
jgi:hypothetical protein